jgi:hypothetical protein
MTAPTNLKSAGAIRARRSAAGVNVTPDVQRRIERAYVLAVYELERLTIRRLRGDEPPPGEVILPPRLEDKVREVDDRFSGTPLTVRLVP